MLVPLELRPAGPARESPIPGGSQVEQPAPPQHEEGEEDVLQVGPGTAEPPVGAASHLGAREEEWAEDFRRGEGEGKYVKLYLLVHVKRWYSVCVVAVPADVHVRRVGPIPAALPIRPVTPQRH